MSRNGKTVVAILSIAFCAFPIASAHPTSWYVGNGDAAALKQTISSAQAGDTVIVGPGTYVTSIEFTILKPLHIISEKGPSETIIANRGYCSGVGGPCYGSIGFYLQDFTGRFTIKGFTIRDHFYGDYNFWGEGIRVVKASGTISNNVFTNNASGVCVTGTADVVIENNLFQTSFDNGVELLSGASAEIRFNTFVRNSGQIWLGGTRAVNAALRNNILALADWSCFRIYGDSVTVSLSCNDIWGNTQHDSSGSPIDYIGVDGNISVDPLFCSDYYLHQDSPCLGANTPALCNGDHMGCYPVPCEVAVKKQSWGKIKSIFR